MLLDIGWPTIPASQRTDDFSTVWDLIAEPGIVPVGPGLLVRLQQSSNKWHCRLLHPGTTPLILSVCLPNVEKLLLTDIMIDAYFHTLGESSHPLFARLPRAKGV